MAEDTDVARRNFLRMATGAAAAAGVTGWSRAARAQGGPARALKLGYVSPQTGPLAGFGETDNFVVAGVRKRSAKG